MYLNTQKNHRHQTPQKSIKGSLKKSKLLAYQYYEEALSCSENYQAASQLLNKAKKLILNATSMNPIDAESFNLLSRIELERGDKISALQAINNAVELEPNNGGYWYSAGHAHLALNQLPKAKFSFEKAIEIFPDETRAEIGLAYTFQELGEPVKAFQMFREIVKVNPDDIQVRSLLLNSATTIKADYYDQTL